MEAAILTASVTVILFVLLRFWEMSTKWSDKAHARKRLVAGLYAEIEANLKLINKFTQDPTLVSAIRAKLLSHADYRPSVIIEESTRLYEAAGSSLFELRSDVLSHVLEFYRLVEQTRALKDVFESAAFLTIEPASRAAYMQDLWDAALAASKAGSDALREFSRTYPKSVPGRETKNSRS